MNIWIRKIRNNFFYPVKIAVSLEKGFLCQKYCLCNGFIFISVNKKNKQVIRELHDAPFAEIPGIIAAWLVKHHVNVVVGKNVSSLTKECFEIHGIKTISIAENENPEKIALEYIR